MGIAVLLFGLLVGIFHFQDEPIDVGEQESLAAAPEVPANYGDSPVDSTRVAVDKSERVNSAAATGPGGHESPYAALAGDTTTQDLAQSVADLVAQKPGTAANVVTIALAQIYEDGTIGEVATIAAAATRAAPAQAPAIAGAVARTLRDRSDASLAAAVATIISLVPDQSRDIGLVVGAVVGDNPAALGMVAQTVAIAVGEETFSSLSEGSGVTMGVLMRESASLGVQVPFDIPAYAAQLAPNPSRVAGSEEEVPPRTGDM